MKAHLNSTLNAQKILQNTLLMLFRQNQLQKCKYLKMLDLRTSQNQVSPKLKSDSPLLSSAYKPIRRFSSCQSPNIGQCSPIKSNIMTTYKLSIEKEDELMDAQIMTPISSFKLIDKDSISQLSIIGEGKQILLQSNTKKNQFKHFQHCQENHPQGQILFSQRELKEIKRDLQIESQGKICKSQEQNKETGQLIGYRLLCKNDTQCPFECLLKIADENSQGEIYFKLTAICKNHLQICKQPEQEINFLKITKIIDYLEEDIIQLLKENPQIKPKQILLQITKRKGEEDNRFIYRGLTSKNYLKAAKKYFDNLIYKARSHLGMI